MTLTATVQKDKILQELFPDFDGTTEFTVPDFVPPEDFAIGLIVGPSGTGKSQLLSTIGTEDTVVWDPTKSVASHFGDSEKAAERLSAVGLNSLPVWVKPYHVLSTGERFRADMARRLHSDTVIDEFTSVIDRTVAKSCSYAIRRYVDKRELTGLVFATCHYDIVEWLQPDWVYDTQSGELKILERQKPTITIELRPCDREAWKLFKDHHYLSADLSSSSRCWLATWDDVVVGFSASIAYPSGTVQNAFREHRTVVLPEFQGLGVGVRISDAVGEMYVKSGYRYFSKTAHPRMGLYRENSKLWKPTTHNKKSRVDYTSEHCFGTGRYLRATLFAHANRWCYCHEYIGKGEDNIC